MNPPLLEGERVIASAIALIEREGHAPAEVAVMLERRFANVAPGTGAEWVRRAQSAQSAGVAAQALLPGESIGQAQPSPLGGTTVLVTALAQYGVGRNAQYRIVRLRVAPGTTMQEIGDTVDAEAVTIDSPEFNLDPDAYVGSVITHVW